MLKPPFALLIIPLGLTYLAARQISSAAPLTAPVALALAAFLLLNQVRFGSPWEFSQAWQAGAFIDGAFGSLFPGRCGYLIVAPAILAAFAAWPRFFRAHPRAAVVLASGIRTRWLPLCSGLLGAREADECQSDLTHSSAIERLCILPTRRPKVRSIGRHQVFIPATPTSING